MKRWLVAAVAAMVVNVAAAAEMVTQAKTIAAMPIPAGKDSKAMFVALKGDAMQMGLGEAVLHGLLEHQPQADATTRVSIRWHAIGLSNAAATQALKQPLSSQFRTGEKVVQPGTVLNVRGDLDSLAEDFLALKARLAKDSPKDTVKQVNNNNTTTEAARNANELGSGGGTSGSPSSGNSPYSLNSDNNKLKTDMVTTSWQDCQPRIDRAGAMTYQQARKVETTESGRLMGTGNCEDHGLTAPIVRTYDGPCMPVIDVQNRKVYHQFVEKSKLGEKQLDISTCTADFQKADEILASTTKCGYRHDFTAGKSVRQETLYYNDLTGTVVEVRDCGDSTQAYAHFNTRNTCSPTIDSVNKQVFFNNRVAFTDGNGAEQYASDCKPDGTASKPVAEEFCSPKYEHDFVNHVSYFRSRAYYVDDTGNKIYVSECGRSATNSFPHVLNTASCGVRNDDTALMTYWKKETQIDALTDGVITIAPCQETSSPTPYAYVGKVNGTTTVIATNTLYTNQSLNQRLPSEVANFQNGISTFSFSGSTRYCCEYTVDINSALQYGTGYHDCYAGDGSIGCIYTPTTADQPIGWAKIQVGEWGYPRYGMTSSPYVTMINSNTGAFRGAVGDRITKRPYLMKYLRGDSSTYNVEYGAHYSVEAYW